MGNVHTVSELTAYIKACFESEPNLKNLTIQGEVSNFKQNYNGHCYFSLKDEKSVLNCVMFRSSANSLRFRPQSGMQVLATGYVGVYEPSGNYQLYVQRMIPDGIGELALAYEQLKNRLTAEGLFDVDHKQAIPRFPKLIGVVTSPTGAVIRDIFNVSKRRDSYSRIVLYPAQVQGAGAAEQIAAGIEFFNKKYPVDVLIVGRGGGSAEDLWCFNEEKVVRAIYQSQIPVISAVGHETDFTLADFAADRRAATPSQAAEMATPDKMAYIQGIKELEWRLLNSARRNIAFKRQHLERLNSSIALRYPERLLENRQQRLDNLIERLNNSANNTIKDKKQKLLHLLEKLELMNPMQVLKRGYGMVQTADNEVVKSISTVCVGDKVKISLSDGELMAEVKDKKLRRAKNAEKES